MKHLTMPQRYAIKAYLESGQTKTFIAKQLVVDYSTIRRELKRNATKKGKYNPDMAHKFAQERKERFGINRKFDDNMIRIIEQKITGEQWSPEQIKGYCDKEETPMVCVERIYEYIRDDKQQGGGLYKDLRHQLKNRKRPIGKHQVIKDKTSIDDRSDVINNKERFGDWEIDLIVGKENKGAMVTIVERTTAMLMVRKLPQGKNAEDLAKQVIEMLLPYKNDIHSITSDNGSEFARHKSIAEKLDCEFYFAHPYASWERGLSENSNKLIRQYILKKSNFDEYSEEYVKQVQLKINRRPRKNLNFETPTKIFYSLVA